MTDYRLDVSEAKRPSQMKDEDRRLKQLVADLSPDREALKTIAANLGKPPAGAQLRAPAKFACKQNTY
ncbi:MAG: hypothetical protein ABSE36_03185 [Terracidiphilus sp.]